MALTQRMADLRILLDYVGKRTAIDVFTAGSSYNNHCRSSFVYYIVAALMSE